MTIDRKDVLRRMRMAGAEPDAALAARLEALGAELLAAARPAWLARLAPVVFRPDGSYTVGPLVLASADLRRTLEGCSRAYLFCATLGTGVDRVLRLCGTRGATDLLIAQATASSLIETFCDRCAAELRNRPETAGATLGFRYAPGYGDLPLAVQHPLLEALDAARRIGLTLTESLQMTPTKSVSAILGVSFR